MEPESKQPFDPAQARQILERRKELDPIRKRPHTIAFGELRGRLSTRDSWQYLSGRETARASHK